MGQLRLFDFSRASEYIKEGVHKQMGRFGFSGSPQFGSAHSMQGVNASRRDEMESLGYVIMYLIDPDNFPFATIKAAKDIIALKLAFIERPETLHKKYVPLHAFIVKANSL